MSSANYEVQLLQLLGSLKPGENPYVAIEGLVHSYLTPPVPSSFRTQLLAVAAILALCVPPLSPRTFLLTFRVPQLLSPRPRLVRRADQAAHVLARSSRRSARPLEASLLRNLVSLGGSSPRPCVLTLSCGGETRTDGFRRAVLETLIFETVRFLDGHPMRGYIGLATFGMVSRARSLLLNKIAYE